MPHHGQLNDAEPIPIDDTGRWPRNNAVLSSIAPIYPLYLVQNTLWIARPLLWKYLRQKYKNTNAGTKWTVAHNINCVQITKEDYSLVIVIWVKILRRRRPQLFIEDEIARKKLPFSLKPSHLFFESLGTRVFWQTYNLFFEARDVWSRVAWRYYKGTAYILVEVLRKSCYVRFIGVIFSVVWWRSDG